MMSLFAYQWKNKTLNIIPLSPSTQEKSEAQCVVVVPDINPYANLKIEFHARQRLLKVVYKLHCQLC